VDIPNPAVSKWPHSDTWTRHGITPETLQPYTVCFLARVLLGTTPQVNGFERKPDRPQREG
jgi:hypothetical protein